MVLLLIALASLIGMQAAHPDSVQIPLHLALDGGVLVTEGKNKSQSFNSNLDASYDFGRNTLKIHADYLKASTNSEDSALHWTTGVRYEYEFITKSRAYLQYYAEADPFLGYVQRDNQGLGYQYMIHQDKSLKWWAEVGYLHSRTAVSDDGTLWENKGRFASYTEWQMARRWSLSGWLQVLPNFTHHDQDLIDYEIALASMLTPMIALKASYLVRFMETPYRGPNNQTISTLNLAATF